MNTENGCVIHSHESASHGAYAIWKQYKTKECYVVIRGTKLTDLLTDVQVIEDRDDEIGVFVHHGVKERTDFIIGDIAGKLGECKRSIIITGHSLGGSVAHYMFLKYVKKHYYDWNDRMKAMRFKAVIFGAPQLTTKSNIQLLINQESNINWYHYESDPGPELVNGVKNCVTVGAFNALLKGNIAMSAAAFAIVKNTHYGSYIPGHAYNLWKNGETETYRYIFGKNWNWVDHIAFGRTYDAITKKGWGVPDIAPNQNDPVKCQKFSSIKNDEGGQSSISQNSDSEYDDGKIQIDSISCENTDSDSEYDDGKIQIDSISCENTDGYSIADKFDDVILYMKDDNSTYIVKRLLDNEKEYEYAMCNDNEFILKQCDKDCNCHTVTKNQRPESITMCSNYQLDSAMSCIVDGKIEDVETKEYFNYVSQTKIGDYYIMDYYCNNNTYERGNYEKEILDVSSSSYSIAIISSLLMIILIAF